MARKVLAPRRIVIALAIVLVLGSASVLAVGATEPGGLGEIPDTWSVPAPRIGDRGNYTYALIDQATGRAIGQEVPYYAFEQAPAETVLDLNGDPVLANVLRFSDASYRAQDSGQEDSPLQWAMQAPSPTYILANGTLPFYDISFDFGQGSTPTGAIHVGDVDLLPGNFSYAAGFTWRAYPANEFAATLSRSSNLLCGLRNALQGEVVQLDASVRLMEDGCDVAFGGVDPERLTLTQAQLEALDNPLTGDLYDDTFAPLGLQELGGRQTLVFALLPHERGLWPFDERSNEVDGLRVWMDQDVPYPVQMAVRRDGQLHVLRLSAFERGADPLATGPGVGPSAPAWSLADAKPWGLDDTGTGGAFPASMAWQAALDDGGLSAYLDAHPMATAFDVAFDNGQWSFQLTDGASALAVQVTQRADDAIVLPAAVPPLPGLPVPLPPQVDQKPAFDVSYPDVEAYPAIDRSTLPTQMPTAASLIERWSAYLGSDLTNATAGLKVICGGGLGDFLVLGSDSYEDASFGEPCVYRVLYTANLDESRSDSDPVYLPGVGRSTIDMVQHEAAFDVAGRMVEQRDLRQTLSMGQTPAALTPATAQEPYRAPPGYADWRFPGAGVAAGAGLLALLAGLGYLLAPLAKGGSLGLYARVTGADVLEHPMRQRLLAAVEAEPGIHLKELSRRTELAWGQTQHHVRKLVSTGALVEVPQGGYTCYFVKGVDRRNMGAAGAIKADGARRLLNAVATTTGLSVGQLALAAGLTQSTAHYHLKRLEQSGLVTTAIVAGARHVMLTALGSDASKRGGASVAA